MEHDCGESSTALLDKVAAARERFAKRSGRYSLWRNLYIDRRLVMEFEAEQVGAFPVILKVTL